VEVRGQKIGVAPSQAWRAPMKWRAINKKNIKFLENSEVSHRFCTEPALKLKTD
jgi:hypothetical protein